MTIFISFFLYFLKTTKIDLSASIDPNIFSSYGSFVGGIVGPFFALAGVLLLRESLKVQEEAFMTQKIENKFFQLMSIAKENSEQIRIRDKDGKRIFITLIRELYESYEVVKEFSQEAKLNIEQTINIAYLSFFYGAIGHVSETILKNLLKSQMNEIFIEKLLLKYKKRREQIKKEKKFYYKVFDGHQSRLGHYYRHLYETIKYINNQPTQRLSYEAKYQYIKFLRAQLSTQEQLLLLWHSLSDIGKNWEKKWAQVDIDQALITKYNLIKNIPQGFSKHINNIRDYYPFVQFEGDDKYPEGRRKIETKYC